MSKIFGKFIILSSIILPNLLAAYPVTTWTSTGTTDMTDSGNWSHSIPNATTTSYFDSTILGINNNPSIAHNAATNDFSTLSFDFLNSASFFTFDINGPYALVFTGPGITGANTDTTLNVDNTGATMTTPYQVSFSNTNSIPTTIGNAVVTATNSSSSTIDRQNGFADVVQILFDGSGGFSGSTGSSSVTVDGTGQLIANNLTSSTITSSNPVNDLAQISFNGSGGMSNSSSGQGYSVVTIGGSAVLEATIDGTSSIVNHSNANDLAQILFDGSGGLNYNNNGIGYSTVTISDEASFNVTNMGTITHNGFTNDLAQVLFDGSSGLGAGSGHSTVTIGDDVSLIVSNTGTISNGAQTSNLAQILFDGEGNSGGSGNSSVTLNDQVLLSASNTGTMSNGTHAFNADDLAQILFNGTGVNGGSGHSTVTLNDHVSLIASNSGIMTNSGNFTTIFNVAQIIFDGGTDTTGQAYGQSTVIMNDNVSLSATNSGTISNSNTSGQVIDLGQILFGGSGGDASTGGSSSSIVTISSHVSLTVSNTDTIFNENVANDLVQIVFDGSGNGSSPGSGMSIVTIGDSATFSASNLGSIINNGSGTANDLAQILFDGSGGFNGGKGSSDVTINGSTVFNVTCEQTSTISNLNYINDIAQILFDGSGGFSFGSGGRGNSNVSISGAIINVINNNGSSIGNNNQGNDVAQILFDGSGGLSQSVSGIGNSVVSINESSAVTAANCGSISSSVGNDLAQILFDGSGGASFNAAGQGSSSVSISGGSSLTASNSGTITNLSHLNDIAQILFDGSVGLSAVGLPTGIMTVSLSNDVIMSAVNSGTITNFGSTSNGLGQILFDGRGGLSTLICAGSPLISALNTTTGTVYGDQIAFYDTTIMGSPTFKATNQGGTLVGGHGISFYGSSTTATIPNIVLESSSLWIDSSVTLPFSIGSLTGDLPSTVPLNQTLNIFTQSDVTGMFNGVISGPNGVVISGSGTQVFGGPNTYGGTTTINGGNLALLSTGIIPHDAIVNSTGVLSGTGTVEGNVLVNYGGTAFPGTNTSLGTLNVNQNYTQMAGAKFLVNVSGELINGIPQSSALDIVGTATLVGSLGIISVDGTYSIGRPYTILTAGTIIGNFDQQVLTSSPFLVVNQRYILDPSVEIVLSTDFVSGAYTLNQENVAIQIDSITVPIGDEEVIINNLLGLSAAQLPSALNQMSGEQYCYLMQVNQCSDARFGQRIFDAVREALQPCHSELICGSLHTWSSYETGYGRVTGDRQAHGFSEFYFGSSGGFYRACTSSMLFGVAYNTDSNRLAFSSGGHNTLCNAQGSLYGIYTSPEYYVFSDLIVGQGYSQFRRPIKLGNLKDNAHSTPRCTHGLYYAECGFNVPLCDVLMQPFLGGDIGYLYAQSFSERKAGSLNLHVGNHTLWTPNLYIGAHFTTSASCFECNADMIYQHRFGSLGTTLHMRFVDFGDSFIVSGRPYSHDGFLGNINFVAHANHWIDFYLEISGELWDHQYYGSGALGIKSAW